MIAVSVTVHPQSRPNTEISCEDRAILAFAGFVSFISLLSGARFGPTGLLTSDEDDFFCPIRLTGDGLLMVDEPLRGNAQLKRSAQEGGVDHGDAKRPIRLGDDLVATASGQ